MSSRSRMVRDKIILRVDQPVEGVQVQVYVLLKDAENKVVRGIERTKKFKWFRSRSRQTCQYEACVKGRLKDTPAKLQNIFTRKRYCTESCFRKGWASDINAIRKGFSSTSTVNSEGKLDGPLPQEDETWDLIAEDAAYVPKKEDVGHILKVECTVFGPYSSSSLGIIAKDSIITAVVVSLPSPPPPRKLQTNPHVTRSESDDAFRVVSYNILARLYATKQLYPYCPMWSLSWKVRKQVLLKELEQYSADVICVQELEDKEFSDFFSPELKKRGFVGRFLAKTRGTESTDGCGVFLRKDKFTIVDEQKVEFNSFAKSLAESGIFAQDMVDSVLKRLSKDNVALLVLAKRSRSTSSGEDQSLVCFANTHIFWDPEYSDVKLWQTQMLVRELERFVGGHVRSRGVNIPVVLCGDFNSEPETPVISLLNGEQVSFRFDPLGVLRSISMSSLSSSLNLQNVYEAVNAMPKVTNYTGHYEGVLDYIFASRGLIKPVSCLLVPEEKTLRGERNAHLPNVNFPSDHIALCVDLVLTSQNSSEPQREVNYRYPQEYH